jgi:hypothetical protein
MILLRLSPEGCLGIERDGEIVATATLICYADRLAWLGMVLTQPEYRGRGFARRLVQRALEIARVGKRIGTVKLDATDQGLPLYESVGFRIEQGIERWSGSWPASVEMDEAGLGGTRDFGLDLEAFGANRRQLLELLAAHTCPLVKDTGFGMWRPGRLKSYLGPCVARSPETAKSLVQGCLSKRPGPWYWDLLPSNREAVRIARELKFKKERTLIRMTSGRDLRGCESMIYAGGGFELG